MARDNWQLRVKRLSEAVSTVIENLPATGATTIDLAMQATIERGIDVTPFVMAASLTIRETCGQVRRVHNDGRHPVMEVWVKV